MHVHHTTFTMHHLGWWRSMKTEVEHAQNQFSAAGNVSERVYPI
jgi:hypothetical protein